MGVLQSKSRLFGVYIDARDFWKLLLLSERRIGPVSEMLSSRLGLGSGQPLLSQGNHDLPGKPEAHNLGLLCFD